MRMKVMDGGVDQQWRSEYESFMTEALPIDDPNLFVKIRNLVSESACADTLQVIGPLVTGLTEPIITQQTVLLQSSDIEIIAKDGSVTLAESADLIKSKIEAIRRIDNRRTACFELSMDLLEALLIKHGFFNKPDFGSPKDTLLAVLTYMSELGDLLPKLFDVYPFWYLQNRLFLPGKDSLSRVLQDIYLHKKSVSKIRDSSDCSSFDEVLRQCKNSGVDQALMLFQHKKSTKSTGLEGDGFTASVAA